MAYVRQSFIQRKYQYKSFSKYSSRMQGHGLNTEYYSENIIKSSTVDKFGGKAFSMFHKWQQRVLQLDVKQGLFYYKPSNIAAGEGDKTDSQGHVDLKGPYEITLDTTNSVEGASGYFFFIKTPISSEHQGRVYVIFIIPLYI